MMMKILRRENCGVWTMNEANTITHDTSLYGFIGEHAQQNRLSVTLNRQFKASQSDAMMIPMNIRVDDFYFTVSNMKKSHVKGAYIAQEFQSEVLELLDVQDAYVTSSGYCDFVRVKEQTLHGSMLFPFALKRLLESLHVKRLAILGSGALLNAMIEQLDVEAVACFDPYIESLMHLDQNVDINRIAQGMRIDLSVYDAVVNLSDIDDFSMVTAWPEHIIDPLMGSSNVLNATVRYDDFLEFLSLEAFERITKE